MFRICYRKLKLLRRRQLCKKNKFKLRCQRTQATRLKNCSCRSSGALGSSIDTGKLRCRMATHHVITEDSKCSSLILSALSLSLNSSSKSSLRWQATLTRQSAWTTVLEENSTCCYAPRSASLYQRHNSTQQVSYKGSRLSIPLISFTESKCYFIDDMTSC